MYKEKHQKYCGHIKNNLVTQIYMNNFKTLIFIMLSERIAENETE